MQDFPKITVSLVTYHNPPKMILGAISSCLKSKLCEKIYVIDNSKTPDLKNILTDPRVDYQFTGKNLGFGAGHNAALCEELGTYHLILNPDVTFQEGTLETLVDFLEKNPDVAMTIPKVLSADGSFQYSARKILPSPWILISRLVTPEFLQGKFKNYFNRYEMRDKSPDETMDVPCISGCFMLARSKKILEERGFDERYFMYMEDIDLCRRIGSKHRIVYYPKVSITHLWARESRRSLRLLRVFMVSAIKYFNKWGWR